MSDKAFSQSCENNKEPILAVLKRAFEAVTSVLEIGSGTGQHAVCFAPALPYLKWNTSDRPENHKNILQWLEDEGAVNLHAPVAFAIGTNDWPIENVDGVFTANTTHIMQVEEAKLMMELVAKNLLEGGVFCQYGPFNVNGVYTSSSNQEFDQHLKTEGCGGIRDIEELVAWAKGMTLVEKVVMPANNFLLIWRK